jgi:hypothetical protein
MGQLDTRIDHYDDKMVVTRTQDCTPIAEACKALHNEGVHGSSEVKHAAKIPYVVVEAYMNQQKISLHEFLNNPAHIRRVVMNPDNSAFRIWKGAL